MKFDGDEVMSTIQQGGRRVRRHLMSNPADHGLAGRIQTSLAARCPTIKEWCHLNLQLGESGKTHR